MSSLSSLWTEKLKLAFFFVYSHDMKVRDIEDIIEALAPLELQESYDNAGLQVGIEHDEVEGVLVCLDITEDIIREASRKKCNLVISHHPLIFRALKCVGDFTYQQRCVREAITLGISLYSAHTNLDNARGGVNFKLAEKIGLRNIEWLSVVAGKDAGSGVVGELSEPQKVEDFLSWIKGLFGVSALRYSSTAKKSISRVAVCGGAGSFLMEDAKRCHADCFITGEFHYHDYFEAGDMMIASLGHYESEKFTIELLSELLKNSCPNLRVEPTELNTNPIMIL